jgi:hypothetical protein
MKTTKILLLSLSMLLLSLTSVAQTPSVTDVTMTDAGSGAYRFAPTGFSNLGNYIYTSTTWLHSVPNGYVTNDAAVFYNVPGTYTVYYSSVFDDPQTNTPDDYTYSGAYTFEITCVPVTEDYPVVVTDLINEQWIVTALPTAGTAPFTYTWSADTDFTVNPDGTCNVPFGDNGYAEGTVVVTDANGCYTWPHSFGGLNPNAQCSLDLLTSYQNNQVELTINYMYGNDPVLYPNMSTIDFGDGTQMYYYEDSDFDGVFEHTYAQPGSYQICVNMLAEDQSFCPLNDCIDVEVIAAGISSESSSTTQPILALYPNPSSGKFIAETKGCDALIVYNLVGEQVASMTIRHERTNIDLPLTSGVYFVQSLKKGSILSTQRMIIK